MLSNQHMSMLSLEGFRYIEDNLFEDPEFDGYTYRFNFDECNKMNQNDFYKMLCGLRRTTVFTASVFILNVKKLSN